MSHRWLAVFPFRSWRLTTPRKQPWRRSPCQSNWRCQMRECALSISDAVILMAGSGSRLRGSDKTFSKPLVPLLGRPLICYTVDALIHAGIKRAHFITGYQSGRMIAAVRQLIPSELESCFIENPDWQKQNGVSLLAAANQVTAPFLLTMSDHLFDESIVDLLLRNAVLDQLNVSIDRKLGST